MTELNCSEISKKIQQIKTTKRAFDKLLSNKDSDITKYIDKIKNIRADLIQQIETLKKEFLPTNYFLKELKKEETWNKIHDLYKREILSDRWEERHASEGQFMQGLEEIFSNLPNFREIDSQEQYLDFLNKLLATELQADLNEVDIFLQKALYEIDNEWINDYDDYIKEMGKPFILSALHSVFLNKYLAKDTVISMDEPPEKIFNFFACYLKKGTFNLVKVGNNAGLRLNGATLNIEEAGDELANLMKSGVIRAKWAGGEAGTIISGGTLRITKYVGQEFASYAGPGAVILADRITDIDEKANVTSGNFLDSFDALMLIDRKDSRIKDEGVYNNYYQTTTDRLGKRIANTSEYIRFMQQDKKKKQLVFVDFESDENLSQGIDGGIVIFKTAPKENIGLEMTGGAIILEDPNLSASEAKKRISKNRSGGIILMRVPDPTLLKPDSTKLIDLEMSDDWN